MLVKMILENGEKVKPETFLWFICILYISIIKWHCTTTKGIYNIGDVAWEFDG